MSQTYEFAWAAREKTTILIFREGSFESLPFEVRLAAPWTGDGYGKIADLKPADRRQLLHVGYAILRADGLTASPTQAEPALGADEAIRRAA